MQLNRKLFFHRFRETFGKLTQDKVNAIDDLIDFIEADEYWTTNPVSIRQLAYTLATVFHETAGTMRPISEYGSEKYFNSRYGPHTAVGKELGNILPDDGARFRGRGFVQITGRGNYGRMGKRFDVDLLTFPDKAKEPKLAYDIMTDGMRSGAFTGKRISDYINEKGTNYIQARRVINGLDKADLIKSYALTFEGILTESVKPIPA